MSKKRTLSPEHLAECKAAHGLFLQKKNELKLSQNRQLDHPSTSALPRQSTSTTPRTKIKLTGGIDYNKTGGYLYFHASHTGPGPAPTIFNMPRPLSRPDTGPYPPVSDEAKRRPAVRTSARWHSGKPYAGGEQASMATARGVAPGA